MSENPQSFEIPITIWLRQLESGDAEAARQLWEHFCRKLIDHASDRLNKHLRRTYDEEDAALSAFKSMCRLIADGRINSLSSREDLWRLLVVITERKIIGRVKYEHRDKRDSRRRASESDSDFSEIQSLPAREPSPEFIVEFCDTLAALLDGLEDEQLREIVQLRLTNHENDEIATKLGITRRTVERKLLLIRARWQQLCDE